jgi:Tol biopolymer transport system component
MLKYFGTEIPIKSVLQLLILIKLCTGSPLYGWTAEEYDSQSDNISADISVLCENGGRVDWSHQLNLIALDKLGTDGYYDIYVMSPDGTNETCLTCDSSELPNKNIGNPAWHPSGQYIVFQAEKAEHNGLAGYANPGFGINNDLYMMDLESGRLYRITEVDEGMGVLHPHFSYDGSKLLWAERINDGSWFESPLFGKWVLKLLDVDQFLMDPSVMAKEYDPLGKFDIVYESHGFSPDDRKIIFTAQIWPTKFTPFWWDIYTFDLEEQSLRQITRSLSEFDEHAHYSQDGKWISWVSSLNCGCNPHDFDDRNLNLWLMPTNGFQRYQLTFFNQPGHPHFSADRSLAADHAWGPDGKSIVLYVLRAVGNRPFVGSVLLLKLNFDSGF